MALAEQHLAVRAGRLLECLLWRVPAPVWKFLAWLACTHTGWQPGDSLWLVFQEAVFNKSTGQVVLKTFSLYRKLLTLFRAGHDQGEVCRVYGTQGVAGGWSFQTWRRVVSETAETRPEA